jgi:hypothetical protein
MLRDKHGHTAVEVAIAKQFAEIVEVLVARIGESLLVVVFPYLC